jgi:glyoxylase-like metal-dependent hydrolase (beta-lactamase superfamily II)
MKKITWGAVTQLMFYPALFPMNAYLVEEDDGVTLIDACMPFVAKGLLDAVKAANKPLTRIVLTHAHEDHIGSVPFLKQYFPEVKIGISSREAAILKGDHSLRANEPQTPLRGGLPKKALFVPDFYIEDQDRVGSLIAVSTPGHSPGHMSFLETRSRTLIAGDAFQTKGGLAVSGHMKLSFPFPAMATWHAPTAITSAERVIELDPLRLAVGHGPALELPLDSMKQAVLAAQQRLNRRNPA